MTPQLRALAEEFIARGSQRKEFDVTQYLFDKQLEFVLDPSRFKTACCSGRAGKSIANAAYLIQEALLYEGCRAIYITLSRVNAKRLIWPELLHINDHFKLGGKPNESDLTIKFGRSLVWASGAATKKDIEKFRGHPIRLCVIDEVQSFPLFLKELIEEVIPPRLFDYNGTLVMSGTPGPVPMGEFFNACKNPAYAHFHWTMFDNPFLKIKSGREAREQLQEELDKRGVTIDHPSIQREFFGQWSLDTSNLVLNYNKDKNNYDELPLHKTYSYIMGIDIGFKDADAICLLAHTADSPITYLVYEDIKTKQGLTELFSTVESLRNKYQPYKIVIDSGGLGLKIAEEMRRRWRIPVYAAEKTRKFENLEILNDALRTSQFMCKSISRFANDAMLLEWNTDKMRPDRRIISDRFHSDIIDAVLYAFRESPAYTYQKPIPLPKEGTKEYYEAETNRMEEEAFERAKENMNNVEEFEWL